MRSKNVFHLSLLLDNIDSFFCINDDFCLFKVGVKYIIFLKMTALKDKLDISAEITKVFV